MDDAIMQMVAVTATTPERARQYLQVTDGDVEQAVSLFFESGGVDLGATVPSSSGARTAGAGDASNPINIDDEGVATDLSAAEQRGVQAVGQGLEDDEAMARRLQEEAYGGTGDGGHDEPIRAPIARQTETLVGGASDYYGGSSLDEAVQQRMEAMQSRRGARRGPGIFNQQPTSRIWNQQSDREALAESTGGASESNARAQHLARLFAPNWALMFDGSWDDARDQGKSEKKWLLVNIQNEKVFDCQALNRDIWKNESVVGTIQENFIFLQYSKDDPRADQYCQYYFPQNEVEDEYPHIAIVDPRTGEQVKLWSKKAPGADDFLMQLYEFLDRYSLNDNARNPVAKRKSEAKKEKSFDMLTEEEQIERALQASLGATATESSLKVPDEDPDDLTRSITDIRQNDEAVADASKNGKAATDTPFAQIPSDRPHEEPPNGPDTTRIQLRHPDGRIVRRFLLNDPVQRIYEYLKATPVDGKDGKEFELVAMGKNLIETREQTIDQAGLKMGTVMVEYID